MHSRPRLIRFALPAGLALLLSACAGAGPGWSYAPLGPSPAPTSAASPTPAASPSMTIEVNTTAASSLAFGPGTIDAPANTVIQVNYTNDSALPHNIHFFSGADSSASDLAKTDVATGPGAVKSVTFTTPTAPGDYFFWCDVHTTAMTGILHVTP